jgi:hypothetical protein
MYRLITLFQTRQFALYYESCRKNPSGQYFELCLRKQTMMKPSIRILLAIISITTLMLGACGTVTITNLDEATAQFKTAVAGTVTAQVPTDTPTPKFTQTYIPTETTVPTITETPTPSPIPPTTVVDTYCDNSAFVADVTIPDHTILAPGQVFEKTWTLKNTGTCTWKPGYVITFTSGNNMRGNARSINQSVAPQEQVNVTVKLFAPNTPGDYSGVWRLANGRGEEFGEFVSVVISVAGAGTPILTPEANTPVVTLTPAP